MDLTIRREYVAGSDLTWLGSAHAVENAQTVPIDVSTLTKQTHYPNGFLPSGFALGEIGDTGVYGPYNNGASDGRETFKVFLIQPISIGEDAEVVTGAGIWHGRVYNDRLPFPLDAPGIVDAQAGQFTIIEEGGS